MRAKVKSLFFRIAMAYRGLLNNLTPRPLSLQKFVTSPSTYSTPLNPCILNQWVKQAEVKGRPSKGLGKLRYISVTQFLYMYLVLPH